MSEIVVSRQKLKEYIKRKFSGLIKKDLEEIVDSKSSHDIKLKIVESNLIKSPLFSKRAFFYTNIYFYCN